MTASNEPTTASLETLKVLTFKLDEEGFGVEISGIQEVLEYRKATRVPRTPEFMLGVINLRGKVIPVVDLRQHFDLKACAPTVDTCIIIIHVMIEGENTPLGILADRVQEVVEIPAEAISPAPRIGNKINAAYIYGMARIEEDFIILLRLSKVFSSDELQKVVEQALDTQDE